MKRQSALPLAIQLSHSRCVQRGLQTKEPRPSSLALQQSRDISETATEVLWFLIQVLSHNYHWRSIDICVIYIWEYALRMCHQIFSSSHKDFTEEEGELSRREEHDLDESGMQRLSWAPIQAGPIPCWRTSLNTGGTWGDCPSLFFSSGDQRHHFNPTLLNSVITY